MVKTFTLLVCSLGVAISINAVKLYAQSPTVNAAPRPVATPTLRSTIDTTVSPCDDFDQYVNGAWRAAPDSNTRNILEDATARIGRHLIRILDSAKRVASHTTDPTIRALGTFYTSCLVADSLIPVSNRLSNGVMRNGGTSSDRAQPMRVDACLSATQHAMGPALHYAYVQDVMSPKVSVQSRALVTNIRAGVRERVQSLSWVGDSVQRKLIMLLDTMTMRIQFAPDTIDYTRLILQPTQYAANLAAITAWEKAEFIRRRDSLPMRKTGLEPPLVPYAPIVQARRGSPIIEVTALFFQPPFFDITAEPAANYAVLGSTLAHEMWHLLTPSFKWMNNTEGRRRVSVMVDHYSKFDRSGWATANEDLSDLGGILSAYAAWQKTARQTAVARIEGFTPEQRFFLYYARSWRSVDGRSFDSYHSGMRTRINGVLMQVPAFASAFGCTEQDVMVLPPAKRAEIF